MSGDWIKVEHSSVYKPEVLRLARMWGVTKDHALGACVRFWVWLDNATVDGRVDGVASQEVDDMMHMDGFSGAMVAVGWLTVDDDAVFIEIPNFSSHNGESSKKRALSNKRQSNWRANVDAHVDGHVDAVSVTKTSTREEKRREEKRTPKHTPKPPSASPNGAARVFALDQFAQFWAAYPKKKSKGQAEKAWAKLNPDDAKLATVLKAIDRAKATNDWVKDAGRYIPHPASWLNAKGWEDEQPDRPLDWGEVV